MLPYRTLPSRMLRYPYRVLRYRYPYRMLPYGMLPTGCFAIASRGEAKSARKEATQAEIAYNRSLPPYPGMDVCKKKERQEMNFLTSCAG
jgi:hypothetical protein